MNSTEDQILWGEDLTLSRDERARHCCADVKKLQEAGKHEEARRALGELWRHIGERPNLEGLGKRAQAEVLLRAGSLSGFINSGQQTEGAQEFAKNLISESADLFRAAGETAREAESLRELGSCYWREGAHDEARVMLHESLARLAPQSTDERAQTLLRLAIVESSATCYNDALRILSQAAPLFDASDNDANRGTFHMELAVVLDALSLSERREDYTERALVEYAAASFHFERAGQTRYRAAAENNYAHLLFKRGDYARAHAHLDTARRLFISLKDQTHTAQVDETRARLLIAESRFGEAEAAARSAVRALSAGGQQAILAEALAVHGEALARLGRKDEARAVLRRAVETAARAGHLEGAGLAELMTLEMLGDRLTPAEMNETYLAADRLLEHTQHPKILARLRASARRLAANGRVEPCVVAAGANLADPWADFSFRDEVKQFEERLIERALRDAQGSVSRAARLLGFKHHESLTWRLKNRNKDLLQARTPARKRQRSIIRKSA